jgi:hypothetical protein
VRQKKRTYLVVAAFLIWGAGTLLSGRLFIQSLIDSKNLINVIAHLETFSGSVAYRSPDSILWNSAGKDQRFANGDLVSTANSSNAKIQTQSGHVIELQSNTMIKLSESTTEGESRDRRNVLQLIQGAMVAKTTSKSNDLSIDAGGKTFEVSDSQNAVLGLAKASGQEPAVVFESLGDNKVVDEDSKKASLVTPIPEKRSEILSALSLASIPPQNDKLPTLAFDLVMPTGPISIPDIVVPTPKIKKAQKITLPKKEIAVLPITIIQPKIEEKIEPPKTYPRPRLTGKLTQTIITFNRLNIGCGLGEINIPYSIVKEDGDTFDDGWKPFMEVSFGGGSGPEIFELEKDPGHYFVKISLDRVCTESLSTSLARTISFTTAYSLDNGSIRRNKNKPSRIIVKSLVGYRKNINLVFSQEPRLRAKTQNWLALDKSDSRLGSETTVSITPASSQPALMRMLPYQRLIGITFSNQMDDKAGVYLVKKADVLLGFTGTIPNNKRLEATAARLGADHGFVGYPRYLKDLKGAPVNKLSLLETIAKQSGPVTVIARGNAFDMTAEDFQKGAKELLWMTSTLSAVYSTKPDRIFFPKAGDY